MRRRGIRLVSAMLLGTNPCRQNSSQHLIHQQSRPSSAKISSAGLHVDVMVFKQILIGVCLWHSRCLGSNAIVFSALLVLQKMNIILCFIVLHIVPPGTGWQTYVGAQPSFVLFDMIPKSRLAFSDNIDTMFLTQEHPGGSTIWTHCLVQL